MSVQIPTGTEAEIREVRSFAGLFFKCKGPAPYSATACGEQGSSHKFMPFKNDPIAPLPPFHSAIGREGEFWDFEAVASTGSEGA